MTRKLDRTQIAEVARFVAPTVPEVAHPARTFELPVGLYAATVGGYLAFLAVLATTFASPGLAIPIAICALSVIAGFTVPSYWARTKPESRGRSLTWGQFRNRGIQTNTGPLKARDATIQVLILPTLILFWGLSVAVIAAVVR